MQNLSGHSAAWRGKGLKVGLPLRIWAGRPRKIGLEKRHSRQMMSARLEGYKDFKKLRIVTKTLQRLQKKSKDSRTISRNFTDACRLEPELQHTDECCSLEAKEPYSDDERCIVVSV